MILCFTFVISILFLLKILEVLPPGNSIKEQPDQSRSRKEEETGKPGFRREYTDPKTAAEKYCKNVLLKKNIKGFGEKLLSNMADDLEIVQGVFYFRKNQNSHYQAVATYALADQVRIEKFQEGESLPGEAAKRENVTILRNLPDDYRRVESGLGSDSPRFLYLVPVIHEKNCMALLEVSTFKELSDNKVNALSYFITLGGKKLSQFLEKTDV